MLYLCKNTTTHEEKKRDSSVLPVAHREIGDAKSLWVHLCESEDELAEKRIDPPVGRET